MSIIILVYFLDADILGHKRMLAPAVQMQLFIKYKRMLVPAEDYHRISSWPLSRGIISIHCI
jgi:hypothetical protein